MDLTNHIKAIEDIIRSKTESLPRAINGDAPMDRLKQIVGDINIMKEIKEILEDKNSIDQSTDQGMIDNEIEFNSRPTNNQILEAINAHVIPVISWASFHKKFVEEHGMSITPNAPASTSTCINACDLYGFQAICHFNLG